MEDKIPVNQLTMQNYADYGLGDFETLRPVLQVQLVQIEEYFQEIIVMQCKLTEESKKLKKLNVLSVATGASIHRSSIYNNANTLKRYIELRITEIEKMDILGASVLEKAKLQNIELEECISGFRTRIVENEILRLEIAELETELKNISIMYENVLKQNDELQIEINQLRRQNKKRSHILTMGGNLNG